NARIVADRTSRTETVRLRHSRDARTPASSYLHRHRHVRLWRDTNVADRNTDQYQSNGHDPGARSGFGIACDRRCQSHDRRWAWGRTLDHDQRGGPVCVHGYTPSNPRWRETDDITVLLRSLTPLDIEGQYTVTFAAAAE